MLRSDRGRKTVMSPDLSRLFEDGREIDTEIGKATLRLRGAGELVVTSGRVVACDPLTDPEAGPFARAVPPGRHPVVLSVAHFEDGDQRVAAAVVRFADARAARWELALLPGQDAGELGEGEVFGYGVDSGTGCFMDEEAAQGLLRKLDESDEYYEEIIDEMDKTYVHTWSWANVEMTPAGANLVAFSTGVGDGLYASYFGLDDAGRPVSLVTDFSMFELEGMS
jgi:hypothetical protein